MAIQDVEGVETDVPGYTVICEESSAPHQGEYASYTIADTLDPLRPRRRNPPRGCTLMAARMGVRLLNRMPGKQG